MDKTIRNTTVFVALAAVLMALLAGASILPDPCVQDTDACCSETHTPDVCGTLCCLGFVATPEVPFVLEAVTNYESSLCVLVVEPEIVTSEPLVRPPISA